MMTQTTSRTNTPVKNISPAELRELLDGRKEGQFNLIDVRQPEEYQGEHIPGAELIPLMELEADVSRLTPAEINVFYCRSGARSMRAAQHVARTLGLPNIFNLDGGVMGYNGRKLPDFPNLRAVTLDGTMADLVRQALNLEKGAQRLYERFVEHFAGTPLEADIRLLAQAEEGHGRALYAVLRRHVDEPLPPFRELFDGLDGDLLESGHTLDSLAARVKELERDGESALLELALDLELQAYDLYRTAAARSENEEQRSMLLEMAGEERRHAAALVRNLGRS